MGANKYHHFTAMPWEDTKVLEPSEFNLNPENAPIFVQDSEVFSNFLGFRSVEFRCDISLEVLVALWCAWHGYLVGGATLE